MTNPEPPPSLTPHVRIDGRDNIVVQVQGDGNSIVIGLPYLTLTRYLVRRRPPKDGDLLKLLHPYALAIPLVGRDTDLARLETWLHSPAPVSVRLLVASAGAGKTRLALELCDRATRTEERPWDAGFVTREELDRFSAQQNLAGWGWRRPTLVVVDYAAAKLPQLKRWLKELAANDSDSQPRFRVLLLERNAHKGAGWFWELVARGDADADAISELFEPAAPVPLPAIASVEDRRAVFASMLERLGRGDLVPPPGDSTFEHKLTEQSWGGEPLFLMLAALTASHAGLGTALSLSRTDAAFKVADGERARIRRLAEARGRPAGFVEHLAAYAALCQGVQVGELTDVIGAEQSALQRGQAGDPADLAAVLIDALPDTEGGVAAVLPHMVGEAFILRALGEGKADAAEATVRRAGARAWDSVVPAAIRLAQDFGQASEAHGAPEGWIERLATLAGEDTERLISLVEQLPEQSAALRELALVLTDRVAVALRRKSITSGSVSDRAALAQWLNRLSNRLREMNQPSAALRAIEESVGIWEGLTVADSEPFRTVIAASYNTLSNALASLHSFSDSLAAAKMAVQRWEELSVAHPEARPRLAESLSTLSDRLFQSGSVEDALRVGGEALKLFESLSLGPAQPFREPLAMVLNNRAGQLSRICKYSDAVVMGERAVGLYRQLATEQPDVYLEDLAMALGNVSNFLNRVGKYPESLARAEEAVALYRGLYAVRPGAFADPLALALRNLAVVLGSVNRQEDAVAASEEVVALYGQLATQDPQAFGVKLAEAQFGLSRNLAREATTDLQINRALEYAHLAIHGLRDPFFQHSSAFAYQLRSMVPHYQQLAQRARAEPDMALILPIVERLNTLQ